MQDTETTGYGALARWLLAIVGIAQGVALHFLVDQDWDVHSHYLMAGLVLALVVPLVFELTYGVAGTFRAILASLAWGMLLALLWLWLDARVQWEGDRPFRDHAALFWGVVAITTYILIPYAQTWLETGNYRFPYPSLFRFSWNNILVLIIAGIFVGIFWLVLLLWWELFNLVGVGFFEDLFTDDLFAWCFSGGVLGLGIAIARENQRIVPTLRRVVLMLFQILAPVLAVASMLFLSFLPFTGLDPLWNTASATAVLVILMFSLVLMVNAVVQDGEQSAMFGRWHNRLMAVAMLLLPLFAAVAFYAIWLRIDQYGLTPERVIAKLIVAVAAIQVIAYSFGVVRYRQRWAQFVYRANPVTALIVVALSLLLLTPLLDPYSRSASSQLARLLDEKADPEWFDFGALKFHMGRPGRDALAEIRDIKGHPQQDVIERRLADLALADNYWSWGADFGPSDSGAVTGQADVFEKLIVKPEGAVLPQDVWAAIIRHNPYEVRQCEQPDVQCGLLAADFDRNGRDEYLFFVSQAPQSPPVLYAYNEAAGEWTLDALRLPRDWQHGVDYWQAFVKRDYELVEPAYFDIRLGDDILRY